MFSLTVRDHIMISHQLRGSIFGPAQRMHGATYIVDAEFRSRQLDETGIFIDIGWASTALAEVLKPLRYRNLNELEEFSSVNTTTEYLAYWLFQQMYAYLRQAIKQGSLERLPEQLKITLHESHIAWASYESQL